MRVPDEDDEGDPHRLVYVRQEVEDSLVPLCPEGVGISILVVGRMRLCTRGSDTEASSSGAEIELVAPKRPNADKGLVTLPAKDGGQAERGNRCCEKPRVLKGRHLEHLVDSESWETASLLPRSQSAGEGRKDCSKHRLSSLRKEAVQAKR